MRSLCVFALILGSRADLLEDAEDAEAKAENLARVGWAAGMKELVLGEDGVEDPEVMPMVGPDEAEASMVEAPDQASLEVLRSRSPTGFQVYESQVVVVSGMATPSRIDERKKRNWLASKLVCAPIYGQAAFMLVHRRPVAGRPDTHELAFFTEELWRAFVDYMQRARASADFFGGPSRWVTKIHWNVLPLESRVPFVLPAAQLQVVATPRYVTSDPLERLGEKKDEL